ncbi:Cell division integral membrane protein, YggT and half-length relatives [hydrothermal vent metagenome]|uniref:Cell division integral membrane protein, YggT and half-length relatives n=1 Tax=hydrothermal vent metagenome TaxID=652676 RepID=A0A3B0Z3F2_9ZZZZ
MGGEYVNDAGVFLVRTLFGLYILAVALRFLLQMARADFYNPICQILVKVTNPALRPLRRIVPGFLGIDMAAIVLLLLLKTIELLIIQQLSGFSGDVVGLVVLGIAQLIKLILDLFFFSILIQVVLSWVNPGTNYNPGVALLHALNEPLMRPARRVLPPMSGLDLSPLLVLIVLQLLTMLLVAPLNDVALKLLSAA